MGSHIIFGIFFSLCSASISLRQATQQRMPEDAYEISNETDFSQELLENNITSTTENDVLFWTVPDVKDVRAETERNHSKEVESFNNTLQAPGDSAGTPANDNSASPSPAESLEVDNNTGKNKSNNDPMYNDVPDSDMNEKIVLQRNNCHLEISVKETHDLKIQIKFGKLQNNTSGKCCITLNGQENTRLGVFISNIYLYQNDSQGEVLKVITTGFGSDFVLKEYYSWTKYEPLILTETQRVYIVLYYKVENVPLNEKDSHFNLEAFSYHKYENHIKYGNSYYESHFPYRAPQNFPTSFVPYFY